MRDVMARTWKDNARELRFFLERAVVLSEAGILDVPDAPVTQRGTAPADGTSGAFAPLHAMVEEAGRRHTHSALERTGGSVIKTSGVLGISSKTLREKMKVESGPGSGERHA
ncbi:hypothetical protein MW290_04170 [Aquincola tertiaricarbonis]|uniref:DNA binding HTH domain-containing protein n=1 Tax=Aquincola tertiaricarbonis TaxID=391953 RepID=A0ABY4S6Y9_AQUTE|nr:helix-turn-helix domain-containing protein [Aquincola tertiaricarbonis]URI07802.1 hypothetical protein MW290_04170 [Aquincola tertiaricarbonis]|tara:strand:+ start:2009 stop:2344 length:336 start_codon:yes stop_codon:yes gene_type:complete